MHLSLSLNSACSSITDNSLTSHWISYDSCHSRTTWVFSSDVVVDCWLRSGNVGLRRNNGWNMMSRRSLNNMVHSLRRILDDSGANVLSSYLSDRRSADGHSLSSCPVWHSLGSGSSLNRCAAPGDDSGSLGWSGGALDLDIVLRDNFSYSLFSIKSHSYLLVSLHEGVKFSGKFLVCMRDFGDMLVQRIDLNLQRGGGVHVVAVALLGCLEFLFQVRNMVFFLSNFNLHFSNRLIQLMIFAALSVDPHLEVWVLHFVLVLQTQQVLELVLEADDLVLDWGDLLLHLDDLVVLWLELRGPGLNQPIHFVNFGLLSWNLKF